MEQSVNGNRIWDDEMNQENLEDFIDSWQPFCFQYRGKDYLIEGFSDIGYIIVDPIPYDADGGWPEKYDFAYPGHLEAKTPQEIKALPFLDGKTIFERFDELKFFEW